MIIFSDGFKRGECSGYVVVDEKHNVRAIKFLENASVSLAELRGVAHAFRLAKKYDLVITDSLGVLNWITGRDSSSKKQYHQYILGIRQHMYKKAVVVLWQPRKFNLAGRWISKHKHRLEMRNPYKNVEQSISLKN